MRILIFIGLKIIELTVLIGTYLGLTRIGWLLEPFSPTPESFIWYNPYYLVNTLLLLMLSIALIGIIAGIFYSVKWFINQNNDWSWNIYHKIQKSKKKRNVEKNNSKL
jgi:hypothetical protein